MSLYTQPIPEQSDIANIVIIFRQYTTTIDSIVFENSQENTIYYFYPNLNGEYDLTTTDSAGARAKAAYDAGTAQVYFKHDGYDAVKLSADIPAERAQIPDAVIEANPFVDSGQDSEVIPEPQLAIFFLVSSAVSSTITTPIVTWNSTTGEYEVPGNWGTEIPSPDDVGADDYIYYSIRQNGVNTGPIAANPNFIRYSATPDGANSSAIRRSTDKYWGPLSGNGQVLNWYPINPAELVNYFDLRLRVDSGDLDNRRLAELTLDLTKIEYVVISYEQFSDGVVEIPSAGVYQYLSPEDITLVDYTSGISSNRDYQWVAAIGEFGSIKRGGNNPTFNTIPGLQSWLRFQLCRANGDTDPTSRLFKNVVFVERSVQPNPNIRLRISAINKRGIA